MENKAKDTGESGEAMETASSNPPQQSIQSLPSQPFNSGGLSERNHNSIRSSDGTDRNGGRGRGRGRSSNRDTGKVLLMLLFTMKKSKEK